MEGHQEGGHHQPAPKGLPLHEVPRPGSQIRHQQDRRQSHGREGGVFLVSAPPSMADVIARRSMTCLRGQSELNNDTIVKAAMDGMP